MHRQADMTKLIDVFRQFFELVLHFAHKENLRFQATLGIYNEYFPNEKQAIIAHFPYIEIHESRLMRSHCCRRFWVAACVSPITTLNA
jgi:hypothetical protein